jgi:hypothetical protein
MNFLHNYATVVSDSVMALLVIIATAYNNNYTPCKLCKMLHTGLNLPSTIINNCAETSFLVVSNSPLLTCSEIVLYYLLKQYIIQ